MIFTHSWKKSLIIIKDHTQLILMQLFAKTFVVYLGLQRNNLLKPFSMTKAFETWQNRPVVTDLCHYFLFTQSHMYNLRIANSKFLSSLKWLKAEYIKRRLANTQYSAGNVVVPKTDFKTSWNLVDLALNWRHRFSVLDESYNLGCLHKDKKSLLRQKK